MTNPHDTAERLLRLTGDELLEKIDRLGSVSPSAHRMLAVLITAYMFRCAKDLEVVLPESHRNLNFLRHAYGALSNPFIDFFDLE